MQKWENIAPVPQRFDILLFDAFSNHCLANTVEPLRAANMLADKELFAWRVCTLDGGTVQSSSGLEIAAHCALPDASGHTLILMPSYGVRRILQRDLDRALRSAARRYDILAGFDMGSWLLAQAGLLDGYKATIHWDELTAFAERFFEVDVLRERFVIDRDRITCSGAMAAFDLVTQLISRDHGAMLAVDVARLFMSRGAVEHTLAFASGGGRTVDRALALMQETIEAPLSIPALARRLGCTQKTLEARMSAALQATPQAAYRRVRLVRARQLAMDTDVSVSEIAQRCGYENASAMTRAFRGEFGVTPRDMRLGQRQA
jgi:transcriptional regulator GlxA family with amidase domain